MFKKILNYVREWYMFKKGFTKCTRCAPTKEDRLVGITIRWIPCNYCKDGWVYESNN